jgi:hypothetical protein
MKIFFRKVEGKQAVFAEIYGTFYRLNTTEHFSELPGEPLAWGNVNSRLKGRLSVMHFLDVDADQDAAQGEANLRIPDPETLWTWTDAEKWKKALAKVEALADTSEQFQAFAHWWEYLRRSEAFHRDCEAMREPLSADMGLTWAAFTGWLKHAYFFSHFLSYEQKAIPEEVLPLGQADFIFYSFRGFQAERLKLCRTWDLPFQDHLPFLFPEWTGAAQLAASFFAVSEDIQKLWAPVNFRLNEKSLPPELKYFPFKTKGRWKWAGFSFPCDHKTASSIATQLFHSRLPVTNFEFKEKMKTWNKSGVKFHIAADHKGEGVPENEFPQTWENATGIIANYVHLDFFEFKTWGNRRRLDPLTLKRELAAFDKDTTLDAKLWPELTGDSLTAAKSRARRNAKKRISQLEKAAGKRRLTLNPAEPLNA